MMRVQTSLGEVVLVPALRDNYIHLFVPHNRRDAIVIDPADPDAALQACRRLEVAPKLVLNTHHHWDHTAGNRALAAEGAKIAAPKSEPIPARSQGLSPGDRLAFGGVAIEVIDASGHTRGHLAYRIGDALFSGDALFAAGCGRLFEGTPKQMWQTLSRLAALPAQTKLFCAHEYTLANLRFARSLGIRRDEVDARIAREEAKQRQGLATIPSTIAEELRTNPFLWPLDRALRKQLAERFGVADDPVAVFAALRAAKDAFS